MPQCRDHQAALPLDFSSDSDFGKVCFIANTAWLVEEKRKYRPGFSAAICSNRPRACARPSTASIQTASLSCRPEKISNFGITRLLRGGRLTRSLQLTGNRLPREAARARYRTYAAVRFQGTSIFGRRSPVESRYCSAKSNA